MLVIFAIMTGQLLVHFSIEYRKYFTNFHATVVETTGGFEMGATEAAVMAEITYLATACSSNTNEDMAEAIDFESRIGFNLPFPLSVRGLVSGAVCHLGI